MKRLHLYGIAISTIVLIAASCGGGGGDFEALPEAGMIDVIAPAPTSRQAPTDEAVESIQQLEKKFVKSGGINFETSEIETDYQSIVSLLPRYNAYIENENQSKSDQQINYNLSIRVPADDYDSLFAKLSKLGVRTDSKYSNVEDVTERYYDLETRIKNKKALESRYVDLLQKAVNVKDILEIERNINQVRTEIEQLEGQFNYLSKQVSYSTINLYFYQVLPYTYDASSRKGFGARMLSALDSGWQGFLSFMVGITSMWPFLLILVGVVYTLIRLSKRKRKEV